MPLDWSAVKNKYGAGFHAPTCAGGKFLKVARAEHEAIYIDSPIWSAKLHRANLEIGVALMEGGTISRDPGLFVEDDMLYVVVIVNEFGEVGNDGQLTMQDDDEQSIEFNNGCLCCTVCGDLSETISRLHVRAGALHAIMIETTGLADPAPLASTFFVSEQIRVGGDPVRCIRDGGGRDQPGEKPPTKRCGPVAGCETTRPSPRLYCVNRGPWA